jgi:hypothetical protein
VNFEPFYDGLPEARAAWGRHLATVRDLVRGVAKRYATGLYLYGRPGTGKTHTVLGRLDELHSPPAYHSGHVTPMGLFELLAENAEGVVVLDDVAQLFRSEVAVQVLLAALGRRPGQADARAGDRTVSYKRKGVERSFTFTGGVIAVSNLELHDGALLEAVKSRVDVVSYDPTDAELAAVMLDIAARGYRRGKWQLEPGPCEEVARFVIEESLRAGRRLDLRALVDKALPKRLQYEHGETETHWRDLVRTVLEERLPKTPAAAGGRAGRGLRAQTVEKERAIAREILTEIRPRAEQLAEWRRRTGKSERAYYRRIEDAAG